MYRGWEASGRHQATGRAAIYRQPRRRAGLNMDIIAGIEIGGTKTIVATAAVDGVIAEQERFVTHLEELVVPCRIQIFGQSSQSVQLHPSQ